MGNVGRSVSASWTSLDLQKVASDIKNTLMAAITDLRADIQAISTQLSYVEQTSHAHSKAIHQVQWAYISQLTHLLEMHRHLEDLNNGACRSCAPDPVKLIHQGIWFAAWLIFLLKMKYFTRPGSLDAFYSPLQWSSFFKTSCKLHYKIGGSYAHCWMCCSHEAHIKSMEISILSIHHL